MNRQTSTSDQVANQARQVGLEDLAEQLKDPETCKKTASFRAACAIIIPTIPGLAAVLSIFAYVVTFSLLKQYPWLQVIAVGSGSLLALFIWLLVAVIWRRFTTVDRANMSSYGYLLNCLDQLLPKLMQAENALQHSSQAAQNACMNSKQEASRLYRSILEELKREKNPAWMAGIGYINVWRCMHYVQEACIEFEPEEDVLRDALHDELCIQGSTIENSRELLQKLRLAVTTLNRSGAEYLNEPALESKDSAGKPGEPAQARWRLLTGNWTTTYSASKPGEPAQARAVIRQVRHELLQFRDDRWESLVRTRNEVLKMTALTGLFVYFLCEFTILIFPSVLPLIEAIALLFLIGAIAGLFSRLYSQSKTDVSIDDYQLTFARLMATPLYSGLAALGGVFIIQKIGLLSNSTANFDINIPNILIAAIFGLTPTLFMNAIQREAEEYKKDLKSTEAPGGDKSKK